MLNKDLKIGDEVRVKWNLAYPNYPKKEHFHRGDVGTLCAGHYGGKTVFLRVGGMKRYVSKWCGGFCEYDITGLLEKVHAKSRAQIRMDELQSHMKDLQANLEATQRQVDKLEKEVGNE